MYHLKHRHSSHTLQTTMSKSNQFLVRNISFLVAASDNHFDNDVSAGYSEDSDYTSDLNYPVGGQHANSSASQFRSAASQLHTPQRSTPETSRENSYDDGQLLTARGSSMQHLSPETRRRQVCTNLYHSYLHCCCEGHLVGFTDYARLLVLVRIHQSCFRHSRIFVHDIFQQLGMLFLMKWKL